MTRAPWRPAGAPPRATPPEEPAEPAPAPFSALAELAGVRPADLLVATELRLAGRELTDEVAHELAALLDANRLEHLALRRCELSDEGWRAIADSLSGCASLRVLDMTCANVGDAAGAAIVRALEAGGSIRALELVGAPLRARAAEALCAWLCRPNDGCALERLWLGGNAPQFDDAFGDALVELVLRRVACDVRSFSEAEAEAEELARRVNHDVIASHDASAAAADSARAQVPRVDAPLTDGPVVAAAATADARGDTSAAAAPRWPQSRPLRALEEFEAKLRTGTPKFVASAARWPARALCALQGDELADSVSRALEVAYVTNGDAWLLFGVELAARCRQLSPSLRERDGAEASEQALAAFKLVQLAICGAARHLEVRAAAPSPYPLAALGKAGARTPSGGTAGGFSASTLRARAEQRDALARQHARAPFRWDDHLIALSRAVEESEKQLVAFAPVQRALLRTLLGAFSRTVERHAWATSRRTLAPFVAAGDDAELALPVSTRGSCSARARRLAQDGLGALVAGCLSLLLQPVLYAVAMFAPPLQLRLREYVDAHGACAGSARLRAALVPWWDAPLCRLLLSTASQLVLVYLLVGLPPQYSNRAPPAELTAASLIIVGSLATEVNELTTGARTPARAIRAYLSDEFNFLDAVGLGFGAVVVAAAPLGGDAIVDGVHIWRTAMRALSVRPHAARGRAVVPFGSRGLTPCALRPPHPRRRRVSSQLLCLCLRPVRLAYLHATFGPYVMMVWRMFGDVLKLVGVLVPIAVAFAVALHVTFDDFPEGAAQPLTGVPGWAAQSCATAGDPDAQSNMEDDFSTSIGSALVVILEVALGASDTRLACARGSRAGFLAWTLVLLCSVVTVVLLLNVIIAAMAKSFDLIYDDLDVNARFVRAKLILAAGRLPIAPPPLNLLAFPHMLWTHVAAAGAQQGQVAPTGGAAYGGAAGGAAVPGSTAPMSAALPARDEAFYEAARSYVMAHISDADAEERWRRTAARRQARVEERMGKLLERQTKSDERIARIDETLSALVGRELDRRFVTVGGGGNGGRFSLPPNRLRSLPAARHRPHAE